MADLVLWKPSHFGAKPEMVIKGGTIAWAQVMQHYSPIMIIATPEVLIKGGAVASAQMGDPNASIPTPQPVIMRPMFGALGGAVGPACRVFVSAAAAANDVGARYGLSKTVDAVRNTRGIGKAQMVHNDATPDIHVDPETFEVRAADDFLQITSFTCRGVAIERPGRAAPP